MAFKQTLIVRALGAELSHHLGRPSDTVKAEDASNHRNGASTMAVLTDDGLLRVGRWSRPAGWCSSADCGSPWA